MNIIEIPIEKLNHAPWNPNQLDSAGIERLTESLSRYGLVEPLVVRKIKDNEFEVLSGNQRLKAIASLGYKTVPCVILNLNDAEAMLLAQALNNLHGEDDQVMKGNLIKTVLSSIPEDKVLSLLPETAESLKSITQFNQEDLAEHLQAWQEAQAARLKHMIVQLTDNQHSLVQDAIKRIMPNVKEDDSGSPNNRGTAIFLLCKFYLDHKEEE
jgi:ParB family transcriptional regulator, chromosome partitioning protein